MTFAVRILLLLALPTVVFFGGAALMDHASKRNSTADTKQYRLNTRWSGYDVAEVAQYWEKLGDSREAERKALQYDLVFPTVYCTAFAIALLLAWCALGRPFCVGWIVFLVATTLVTDWIENLVQLQELARYICCPVLQTLDPDWIGLASVATRIKLLAFASMCVVLVAMTIQLTWPKRIAR